MSANIKIMDLHRKIIVSSLRKTPYIKNVLQQRDNLLVENQQLLNKNSAAFNDKRAVLSNLYIKGSGIEIGALHYPLPLSANAKIQYVDRLPTSELRQQYPELNNLELVDVDIIDDGEKLTKIKPNSLDFIIANHFLEHCHDPIGTLMTFYKKLRNEGVLYMAIPDKRYTFDMFRPITSYAHLLTEHQAASADKYYAEHAKEIIRLTEKINNQQAAARRLQELIKTGYSIHYHVWTQKELIDFFYKTFQKFSLDLAIESVTSNEHEVIFIIRKRSQLAEQSKIKAIAQRYATKRKLSSAT